MRLQKGIQGIWECSSGNAIINVGTLFTCFDNASCSMYEIKYMHALKLNRHTFKLNTRSMILTRYITPVSPKTYLATHCKYVQSTPSPQLETCYVPRAWRHKNWKNKGKNWTSGWQPTTMTSADVRGISGTRTMQPAKHVSPARHVVSGRTQRKQKGINEEKWKCTTIFVTWKARVLLFSLISRLNLCREGHQNNPG